MPLFDRGIALASAQAARLSMQPMRVLEKVQAILRIIKFPRLIVGKAWRCLRCATRIDREEPRHRNMTIEIQGL
jgi:hypothetical protein